MKLFIAQLSILMLITSCGSSSSKNAEKSNLTLSERVVNFSDNYCKNNLTSFSGKKMKVTTTDIYKECESGTYYAFKYDSYSSDLSRMITGEVIIKHDKSKDELSLFKNKVLQESTYNSSNSVYMMLSSGCSETKISFSKKY